MEQIHVLSVFVNNCVGVLTRISGLFARRGYNIKSLTVGETENPAVSRMTIECIGDAQIITQIKSQLRKVVDVISVEELKAAFELNTLDEAMAWCKENHLPILLEIKSVELLMHDTRPMLAERIVECLRKYDMFEDCIVFGIDHRTLRRIKTMEPRTHLALIVPHVPHDPVKLMREMEAEIYLCFQTNLSKPLVRELQEAGYLVDGSVVNTKEQLETALGLGVDMIESDRPFEILAAYDELTGV